jgi:hypothetical protein
MKYLLILLTHLRSFRAKHSVRIEVPAALTQSLAVIIFLTKPVGYAVLANKSLGSGLES